MGSYAECWLGQFYLGPSRNGVDAGLMGLFTSSDKTMVLPSNSNKKDIPVQLHSYFDYDFDHEEELLVYYCAPVWIIRDRLELQGYTLETSKAAFNECIKEDLARYRILKVIYPDEALEVFYQQNIQVLEALDVDTWLAALCEMKRGGFTSTLTRDLKGLYEGTLIGYMLHHEWYGYNGPDLNVGLRLAMEVCSDKDELLYDLTEIVLGGGISRQTRTLWITLFLPKKQ